METILVLIYWCVGYWAVGKTLYANQILIGTAGNIFLRKAIWAFLLGWILIPIAIIKSVFFQG